MEEFIPVIVGTDMNAFTMMASFHEAYGVKSILAGKTEVQFTRYSDLKRATYFDPHFSDDDVFMQTLLKIHADFKARATHLILIGTNDKYQNLIINHQEELRAYFKLNVPKQEVRDAIFEKKAFYATCEKYQMSFPETHYHSCEQSMPFNASITYPVIVKPSNGVAYFGLQFDGQQKIYKVDTEEELNRIIQMIKDAGYNDELIVQEYIPGDDTQMFDAVFYADSNGKPQLITFGQVLLQEPQVSAIGNYTAIMTRFNEELMTKLVQFLTDLGYTGFANFDIKYDKRDDTFKLFEVNIRQGRSSYYTTATGHNMAEFFVDDLIYHKEKDLLYLDEDFLFMVVPKGVLKRYVKNKPVREEAMARIVAGHYGNPLFYKPDLNLKKRIYLFLRQAKYFKKYKENRFN